MNNVNNTLGENIRKLREMHNMTQQDLAELVDRSDKTVSAWERGETVPGIGLINKMAEIFKIPATDLLKGYVSENLSRDQNMEQIMNFMNDINKKINYLMDKHDVTADYMKASEANKISFTKDVMEECVEPYEPDPSEQFMKEIVEMEIAERVAAYQFDDALTYCDELIAKGDGEMAHTAMSIYDNFIDMLLCGADPDDIDAEWENQRKYAKIYIHHLMKRFRFTKDDFLE